MFDLRENCDFYYSIYLSEVFNVTLRQIYYILIETKAVVNDLHRKYKTEWWQRNIRHCEGRENDVRAIAYS